MFSMLVLSGCPDQKVRSFDRANELAYQGNYNEALDLFDRIIGEIRNSDSPIDLELKLRSLESAGGLAHLFMKNPQRALAYYRRIVELAPGSDHAFHARDRMAVILKDVGDNLGAIAQLQALVAAFSDRTGVDRFQYELVQAYFSGADYEQARTEAEFLLDRWPDSSYADRVKMLVATTHQIQGDLDLAVLVYRELRQSTLDEEISARTLAKEAEALAGLGRKEDALDAYLKSLRSHPEPKSVRDGLERLKRRMSRREIDNLGPAW